MLESLHIRNFQKHKNLKIEFDSPIVTITGQSDRGKSAILRALRWLCLNQPSGDAFIRTGAESVKVELQIDSRSIQRARGKTNTYHLDGNELKAFGQDVPDAISDFLKLGPNNFQCQMDSPFWFSLSPGQVSKELNSVVNLESIDSALAFIASKLRKAKAEEEVNQDRLKAASERKESLRWAKELDADLVPLEAKEAQIAKKRSRIALAALLIEKGSMAYQSQQNANKANLEAKKAIAIGQKALDLSSRCDSLRKLLNDCIQNQKKAASKPPDLDGLDKLADRQQQLSGRIDRLKKLMGEVETWQERKESLSKELKTIHSEMTLPKNGNCPMCGKMLS